MHLPQACIASAYNNSKTAYITFIPKLAHMIQTKVQWSNEQRNKTHIDDTSILCSSILSDKTANGETRIAVLLIVLHIVTPCYWHVVNNPSMTENIVNTSPEHLRFSQRSWINKHPFQATSQRVHLYSSIWWKQLQNYYHYIAPITQGKVWTHQWTNYTGQEVWTHQWCW